MDEELLIKLVSGYGELYDAEHKLYEDQNRREVAWQEIAKKIRTTPNECRDKWKRLRDNYRKARKLRKSKKAQGFAKVKPIKYEKIMAFIDNIIDRRDLERTEPADEDSESESSSTFIDNTVPNEVPMESVNVVERNYGEHSKSDTIITFFTNLGETVKTFPEEVQIRVKREIFKIINEAEEEVLTNKMKRRQMTNVKYESEFDSNF